MIRRSLLLAAALIATPALADSSSWPPVAAASAQPLGDTDRLAYARAFAAIHAKDWASAAAALDAMPNGALTNVARAELYLAKDAPAVDGSTLLALATAAPDLPEAPALAKLALTRGAIEMPLLPVPHSLVRVTGPSKRAQARPTQGDALAAQITGQVTPLLKANDGYAAEYMIEAVADRLAPDALAELRARTAWAYFLAGDDADAQRVATLARGGIGDWAVQANWVAGLAAWRSKDYATAAEAFDAVAGRSADSETIAAGFFWAARSNTAAGRIDRVSAQLRSAARLSETFYGLLAGVSIGQAPTPPIAPSPVSLDRPNLRAAAALAEIGESELADEMLRQQA